VSDGKPTLLVKQYALVVPGTDAVALVPVLHRDVVGLWDVFVFEERKGTFYLEDGDFEEHRARAGVKNVHTFCVIQVRPHRKSSLLSLLLLFLLLSQVRTRNIVWDYRDLQVFIFRPRCRGRSCAGGTFPRHQRTVSWRLRRFPLPLDKDCWLHGN
jgi:hypothetical protein